MFAKLLSVESSLKPGSSSTRFKVVPARICASKSFGLVALAFADGAEVGDFRAAAGGAIEMEGGGTLARAASNVFFSNWSNWSLFRCFLHVAPAFDGL